MRWPAQSGSGADSCGRSPSHVCPATHLRMLMAMAANAKPKVTRESNLLA